MKSKKKETSGENQNKKRIAIFNNTPSKIKFSFDDLKNYTEQVIKKYLDAVATGTQEEQEKEEQRKDVLRESLNSCFAGTIKERQYAKQFIQRILTGQVHVFIEDMDTSIYTLTPENYDKLYDWENPFRLPIHVKFLGLLYYLKPVHEGSTFEYLVEKYRLNTIREMHTLQGDNRTGYGIYINEDDVNAMFINEGVVFDYELAMDVLTQMIYEESRGNGCIDELLYQNIDDIGIGLSGLQNDIEPMHLKGKKIKKAYDGAWIKYRGSLMHLEFLTFHSFSNLKRVVTQLVQYEQVGSFSEKDGYKMGYGKDGSRRTSVITPFAENPAAWVRKFTAKSMTNRDLITAQGKLDIGNVDKLIAVEKALVMCGTTIPICGPQGAGKTTKLEAITEYIQNWYAIRMIESEFEARIRWRYPEKNILTVQTTQISPEDAYEFSLRTSGDIYIVSEVRSDEMMVNITRTANRGGRSVLFTYHPNKPRATVIEVANSLIRQKLYTSLKDAMYTTLEVIKCCIHIEVDLEKKCRYYNIYEFIPVDAKIKKEFLTKHGNERNEDFQETMYSYFMSRAGDEYFDVVPIITFNRGSNSYIFQNTVSDRIYTDMLRGCSRNVERETIEKLFRPQEFLRKFIDMNGGRGMFNESTLRDIAQENHLTEEFIDYKTLLRG